MTSSPALSGGEGAAAQQVQKFANITGHHFFSYTYNSICLNFIFFLTSYFLLLTSYFLPLTSVFYSNIVTTLFSAVTNTSISSLVL